MFMSKIICHVDFEELFCNHLNRIVGGQKTTVQVNDVE